MQAVLYVSHGSRVKKGVSQATQFIESCMARVPLDIQEICYLELVDPDIAAGVIRCIERGATEIIVQPVLLLAAGHVKKDIPKEIEKVSKLYPEVTFIFSEPFGSDEKIIDILVERIIEKGGEPFSEDSMVLLVGRGSSDPDISDIFAEISGKLSEKGMAPVNVAYLAACEPRFHVGLDMAKKTNYEKVFVVPYLMFTGILMKEMQATIETITSDHQTFVLCDSLGAHDNLIQVLTERIETCLGQRGNP